VKQLTVALAVSGHGYGHSVRCAGVARALLERGARVVVRTDAPTWLYPPNVVHIPGPGWPLDIGVAQHDGLELDIDTTRARWRAFAADLSSRAEVEANLLCEHAVDVVVGDIPPLAFAAASRVGLPSFGLGNFGWDWIYAAWPDFDDIVAHVRGGYAYADALLRLPLHAATPDAFPAFKRVHDVPLIARKAARTRTEVRSALGIDPGACAVLLGFGGFTAHGLDLAAFGRWSAYTFVLTPPLGSTDTDLPANVLRLNETPTDYVSLIAACDVVVTKPGYGIVVDCLANRVAVLFTDRGPFREYDVLAEALPRLGPARHIPREDLLQGYLGPHLDALLDLQRSASSPWSELRLDGAQRVADLVLSCRGGPSRYDGE
jgi:hypothetical protein